jgi:hypothetical protein
MMFGPEICVVGKKIVKLSREYLQYLVVIKAPFPERPSSGLSIANKLEAHA